MGLHQINQILMNTDYPDRIIHDYFKQFMTPERRKQLEAIYEKSLP